MKQQLRQNTTFLIQLHVYVHVTFTIVSLFVCLFVQLYSGQFEVTTDGPSQTKSKGLTFELQGEGNLPQVSVIKPKTFTGEHGHYVLLFRKLLLGEKQVLPIVLGNSGTIPATVTIDLEIQESEEEGEEEGEGFGVSYHATDSDGDECVHTSLPLTFDVPVEGTQELLVSFRPQSIRSYKRKLTVCVEGNQFESMLVSLMGEGYQDNVVVHNIRGPVGTVTDLTEGDIEG